MALEIEYKYLVKDLSFQEHISESHEIAQGYLSREKGRTVRVRTCDDKAYITIKGPNSGAARAEFEYEIPHRDALELLQLCAPPILRKTRSIVLFDHNRWEIDVFHDQLDGLILAEIEVPAKDFQFNLPPFIGRDVTLDRRFYNSCLTDFDSLKSSL